MDRTKRSAFALQLGELGGVKKSAAALIVRELESPVTKLLFDDAALLDQVLERALLLTANPADGG